MDKDLEVMIDVYRDVETLTPFGRFKISEVTIAVYPESYEHYEYFGQALNDWEHDDKIYYYYTREEWQKLERGDQICDSEFPRYLIEDVFALDREFERLPLTIKTDINELCDDILKGEVK